MELPLRVLCLTNPGTNSRGLLLDLAAGFEELGHQLFYLDLAATWHLKQIFAAQADAVTGAFGHLVKEFIDRNHIDFSFAMWSNATLSLPLAQHPHGRLSTFFDAIQHPHLHYWWDAPHWFNNGAILPLLNTGLFSGPLQLHAINNPHTAAEMQNLMGFANVIAAPNAANPKLFRPHPEIKPEYDLIFLSGGGDEPPTPVMLEELAKETPDIERIRRDVAARLAPRLDAIAGNFPDPLRPQLRRFLDAMLEQRLADRHAPALTHLQRAAHAHRDLANAALELTKNPIRFIEATAAIRSIETWERPFLVAFLSRFFKCLRLGQQSYDAWGIRGDIAAFVPYERQSEAYARARFALNVMRWQDDCSLNSKIFEITAARTGCLQAWRAGVEELFEPEIEIATFKTPAEARDKLSDLLANPARSEALVEAGHQRTLRDHTWKNRAALYAAAVKTIREPQHPRPAPVEKSPTQSIPA